MDRRIEKTGLLFRFAYGEIPEHVVAQATVTQAELVLAVLSWAFLYLFGFAIWVLGFLCFCAALVVLLSFAILPDPVEQALIIPAWISLAAPTFYIGGSVLFVMWRHSAKSINYSFA